MEVPLDFCKRWTSELAFSSQTSNCCFYFVLFSTCSSCSSTGVWVQPKSLREDHPRSLPGQLQVGLGRTGSRPVVQLARHHEVSTVGCLESADTSLKLTNTKGIGLERAFRWFEPQTNGQTPAYVRFLRHTVTQQRSTTILLAISCWLTSRFQANIRSNSSFHWRDVFNYFYKCVCKPDESHGFIWNERRKASWALGRREQGSPWYAGSNAWEGQNVFHFPCPRPPIGYI